MMIAEKPATIRFTPENTLVIYHHETGWYNATKHDMGAVSISAARANKRASKAQMFCPLHGVASAKCRTAWGIDTGNVAIYTFPCGCEGRAKIRSAKS